MMAIGWSDTVIPLGWLGDLEQRIANWLNRRTLNRLLQRYGGIQQCPYCKQCAQSEPLWYFDSDTDPSIDALHCGNCGGVSRWRFEMGMLPLEPIGLHPPQTETGK